MKILFEDNYLILINKAAGLQTEPDAHGYPSLLDDVRHYLESTRKKRPVFVQPVHRLDRPVSGVVLFALKPSSLKNLNAQFAGRQVRKTYLAITTNRLNSDSGTLRHFLKKDPGTKAAVVRDEPFTDAAEVRLDYELIKTAGKLYFWKLNLHTGKYHQIRAQFARMDCPILGDKKYGSPDDYFPDAIALHAAQLDFNHPFSGERLHIEASAPDDTFWNQLDTTPDT